MLAAFHELWSLGVLHTRISLMRYVVLVLYIYVEWYSRSRTVKNGFSGFPSHTQLKEPGGGGEGAEGGAVGAVAGRGYVSL